MGAKRQEVFKWVVIIFLVVFIYKFVNRDSLLYQIRQNLPPREAAIMAGMIVGEKADFEKGFYNKLKETGLVHLVVVSGTNVLLLSKVLIEGLAKYLGRKKSAGAVIIIVWGYASMVGWEPPVTRAALLVSIMYWAQILGRKFDVWRGLGLAVGIMLVADWQVIKSTSFWLSMAAFGAVLTSGYMIYDLRFMNKTIGRNFWQTVWISVWTMPILGLVFGKVSWIAPFTNALVLVVVEWISLVGLAGVVWGKVMWLAYPALKYIVWVVEGVGEWKWVSLGVRFNWLMVAGWYLVLFYFLVKRRAGHDRPVN
ncbi:MAG: ComEC/Rec2 family competence protein [Candidatus Shapirobacteria bacterium]|jgi:competence protein ComEC